MADHLDQIGIHEFQSPDGDFVYSDRRAEARLLEEGYVFQSPDGDFVYSDQLAYRKGIRPTDPVSIP